MLACSAVTVRACKATSPATTNKKQVQWWFLIHFCRFFLNWTTRFLSRLCRTRTVSHSRSGWHTNYHCIHKLLLDGPFPLPEGMFSVWRYSPRRDSLLLFAHASVTAPFTNEREIEFGQLGSSPCTFNLRIHFCHDLGMLVSNIHRFARVS